MNLLASPETEWRRDPSECARSWLSVPDYITLPRRKRRWDRWQEEGTSEYDGTSKSFPKIVIHLTNQQVYIAHRAAHPRDEQYTPVIGVPAA